jgi:hypothetical protein
MKCPYCKEELNDKTIKIKELNLEVEVKIHEKGKLLSEIKIPKGWRLLNFNEIVWLFNSKYREKLNLQDTWEFIEQPFELNKKKGYVARFYADSVWASLYCFGDPDVRSGSLGVRFCKDLKGDKK